MKLSRRANTIILWFVSIGLLLGMVITFTPSLGGSGGLFGSADTSAVALSVNGEPIRELQVAQTRSNPLFVTVTEGEVGEDLELLLVDTLIRQEVVRQDAARQRVTDGDVRTAVTEFRVSRGVDGRSNDQGYLNLIAGSGFTDQTFRDYLREQLRQQRWEASLVDGIEVSDDEARAFFESNRDAYLSEERIEARDIVTESLAAATEARARLLAGEDAADVAREVSVERADRDGALGAAAGETDPRPVGRPALPTPVATAAFGLSGPGVTEVVESDARFHVVVVEDYLAAERRPFDEVAASVREDALAAKQVGVLERAVEDLVATARIEFPATSELSFDDEPVARVGDVEILRSELVRSTYTNPQIQQSLSPDSAILITAFFKPAILGQLVDQELAAQGAGDLGVPFVGTRSQVAQSALAYVARDAEAAEADVVTYYEQNPAQFTVPASADALRVDLGSIEAAAAFRERTLAGEDVVAVAGDLDAGIEELGTVRPGQLEGILDTTLFGTEAFTELPDGVWAISDVLAIAEAAEDEALPDAVDTEGEAEEEATAPTFAERYVVLVAQRTPERLRPLEDVRAEVTNTVLAQERAELRDAWLTELRARIDVEESLGEAADAPFVFGDEPLDEATDAATDEPADGGAQDAAEGGEAAPDGEPAAESEDGAPATD
ncbi:MAG: peptidyl-prolyl cis-trans isomerase [Trueperaceae bacterium]